MTAKAIVAERLSDEELRDLRRKLRADNSRLRSDEWGIIDSLLGEALRARAEAREWQALLGAVALRNGGAVVAEGPLLALVREGKAIFQKDPHPAGTVAVRVGLAEAGATFTLRPTGTMGGGADYAPEGDGWAPTMLFRCLACGRPGVLARGAELHCAGCGHHWETRDAASETAQA